MKRIYVNMLVVSAFIFSLDVRDANSRESYCNERATPEAWYKYDTETSEKEVLSAMPVKWRALIKKVITLHPMVEEKKIFDLIDTEPFQEIRVRSYAAQLVWHLPPKAPEAAILIDMYKGCISRIGVFNMTDRLRSGYFRNSKLTYEQ